MSTYNYNGGTTKRLSLKFTKLSTIQTQPQTLDTEVGRLARKVLDLGLYISISGIVTFKNAVNLQEIVKWLPLDRIIIETDAPYLAPIPFRGKRNEPAFVKYVADFIAQLKNLKPQEVYKATTENFIRLFFPSNFLDFLLKLETSYYTSRILKNCIIYNLI